MELSNKSVNDYLICCVSGVLDDITKLNPEEDLADIFNLLKQLSSAIAHEVIVKAFSLADGNHVRLLVDKSKEHSELGDKKFKYAACNVLGMGEEVTRIASQESDDLFDDHITQTESLCVDSSSQSISTSEIPDFSDRIGYYEVNTGTYSQHTLHLIPGSNFCSCEEFQTTVLKDEKAWTCCHVVAIWLAHALGKVEEEVAGGETLAIIARRFVELAHEFH